MGNPTRTIAIHGPPRSGTSWLSQIFDSHPSIKYKYQPLFSDSFKDRVGVRSSKDNIEQFFSEVFNWEDEFLDREKLKEKGSYPRFEKDQEGSSILCVKHVRYHYLIPHFCEVFDKDRLMVVGIIRHPCGFLNSWRKAPREFLPAWDFQEEWRFAQRYNLFRPEEYYGFHRWKEVAKLFLEMRKWYPDNFQFIHYEDLVKDSEQLTKELFEVCNLDYNEQTHEFLERSTSVHQENEYSVFKGNKDLYDWKRELDRNIIEEVIGELEGTEFEEFLK